MTTVQTSVSATTRTDGRAPTDLRPATRVVAALILPVGPALVAVLRYVMPYSTTDDTHQVVREVAADQGIQSLVVWLGFFGAFALAPAVMWVGRLTRPAAPRLTAAALLLLVPGYTALMMLVASDAAVLFAVKQHVGPNAAADAFTSLHPVTSVAGLIFVPAHVVGTILLGIAFWRTGAVPRWAAVATIAAQPLHFIAAIIVSSHPLDLVGWGLNAVGFAAASLAILRVDNDQWDVAPRTRLGSPT